VHSPFPEGRKRQAAQAFCEIYHRFGFGQAEEVERVVLSYRQSTIVITRESG